MGKKIYFAFILLFTLFSYYFQFFIVGDIQLLPVASFLRDSALLLAGYTLYFKKSTFDTKQWKFIYKFVLIATIALLVYQILPNNYYGDFSFLNGSLLTNIFVSLLFLGFYIPLFFAVYELSSGKKKK